MAFFNKNTTLISVSPSPQTLNQVELILLQLFLVAGCSGEIQWVPLDMGV